MSLLAFFLIIKLLLETLNFMLNLSQLSIFFFHFFFRIPIIDTNSLVKVHSKTKQASFVTTISDANNGKKYSDKSDNNTKNAELNNDVDDKNYSKNPTKKSRQVPPPPGTTEVPSFSRKVKVICFILSCCCVIAIVVNFINLHSDYEELQEFYIGYMGRKVLIQEQRLTSRTYLNLLRRAQKHGIEVINTYTYYSFCEINFSTSR